MKHIKINYHGLHRRLLSTHIFTELAISLSEELTLFIVYRSNQLEVLKGLVTALMIRDPLLDPFGREVILVQSAGMAQWLQIQLAQDFGISANIDCSLPAAFVWKLFTQILPNVPAESPFSKTAMNWKLMTLLPQYQGDDRFRILNHYLSGDSQHRKLYQLANQISDLFDHYLVYRPEWITAWQQNQQLPHLGADQLWQATLWRALVQYSTKLSQSSYHRANLYHDLITQLLQKKDQQSECLPIGSLPKRLFIFGISSLSPIFLQLLQALAHHMDIHMMTTDPCRHYWWLMSASLTSPSMAEHPLLGAWAQQGCEQRCLLAQFDAIDIDAMADITPDTLLHTLQYDLLELERSSIRPADHNDQLHFDPHDISLTLHSCYSPLREVEVLHDNLLAFMDADATLTTGDIVIMVTDLQQYTPYIQAIFGQAPADRYLPFTLANHNSSDTQPIVRAFLKLLSLPSSRFQAEEVLSLLEIPSIAARFSIDESGLQCLRQWISTAGIRWGLDEHQIAELQLPTNGRHTWQFGLTRMLLGYAMSDEAGPFRGILPCAATGRGAAAELVGHLANFLAQLTKWRQCLSQPRRLSAWLPYCHQLLSTFFVRDIHSEAALILLEQQWQQWIRCGIESHYDRPLSITLMQEALAIQLKQAPGNEHFLTGSLTFCSLMPLRTIPFKVICLLGMNDGHYPRPTTRLSFDLMSRAPRLGDHNHSSEDRYLFLEALLSAQSHFYISYVGRSIQDNRRQHPSILVSELLDYCCQHYRLRGDETLTAVMAAERLRQHLLHEHPLTPFDPRCFQSDNRWQSYATEWLAVAREQGIETPLFWQRPLTRQVVAPPMLTLTNLQHFYRHPVRSFFQQRLQIKFPQNNQVLLTEEPFSLNALARYHLNQSLLNTLITQGDITQLYQRITAAGTLPHGEFGLLLWQQQCQVLQPLVARIHAQQLPTETCVIDLTINGIRLSGIIPQVQADGLLRWCPVDLQITHGFELWLEHLCYCAMGYAGSSRLYGIRDSSWHFNGLVPEKARSLLAELLDGWQQGQRQPLLLVPKCSWIWLQTLYQPLQKELRYLPSQLQKAEQKLRQAWQGNRHCSGESSDPYYQRLFSKLTPTHVAAITSHAERFLLPLAQYRCTE